MTCSKLHHRLVSDSRKKTQLFWSIVGAIFNVQKLLKLPLEQVRKILTNHIFLGSAVFEKWDHFVERTQARVSTACQSGSSAASQVG